MVLTMYPGGIIGPLMKLVGNLMNWFYEMIQELTGSNKVIWCILAVTIIFELLTLFYGMYMDHKAVLKSCLQSEIDKIAEKYEGQMSFDSAMEQSKEINAYYAKWGIYMYRVYILTFIVAVIQLFLLISMCQLMAMLPAYIGDIKLEYEQTAAYLMEDVKDVEKWAKKDPYYDEEKDEVFTQNHMIDLLYLLDDADRVELLSNSVRAEKSYEIAQRNVTDIYTVGPLDLRTIPMYERGWTLIVPFLLAILYMLQIAMNQNFEKGWFKKLTSNINGLLTLITSPLMAFIGMTATLNTGIYFISYKSIDMLCMAFRRYLIKHMDYQKMLDKKAEKIRKKKKRIMHDGSSGQ